MNDSESLLKEKELKQPHADLTKQLSSFRLSNNILGQLIIIGNGFDLQCNLKSSYADFYKDRYEDPIRQKLLNINTGTYFNKEFSSLDCGINVWDYILNVYFEFKNEQKPVKQWSSIEEIIELVINNHVARDMFNISETNSFYFFSDLTERICSFDPPFGILKDKYLESNETKKYFYFLKSLAYITLTFSPRIKSEIKDMDNTYPVKKFFLDELKKFEKSFSNYLKRIYHEASHSPNINYLGRSSELMETLTGTDLQLGENEKLANSILSFNYTTPFHSPDICQSIYCLRNVHGSIDTNGFSNGEIIFGIDSENIEKDRKDDEKGEEDRTGFTKTFRTLFLNSNRLETNIFDYPVKIIKVYGHSLDEGDYSYFQSIFDAVDLYNNKTVYIYFYYSTDYDRKNSEQIKYDYFKKVAHLFEEYGTTIDNPYHGRNMLHRLILENRIHIKEISRTQHDATWSKYTNRLIEKHI
ncbi:MAG: AbiH family protein [Oenococcus oeni]